MASIVIARARAPRLAGYVELLRPANVVTAAADVLAGYAVAGLARHAALPWLLVATVCLYAGGVVLNDVCDVAIDRRERPERPLPSGRVTMRSAAWLAGVLLALGVVTASRAGATAALVALATAALIVLYDAWGKRQGLIGPVNMGLCRAANLGLGMAAVPAALRAHWWLLALPLVYIAAVTAVSRGEVHGGTRHVTGGALLSLSVVLMALILLSSSSGSAVTALLLCAVLAVRVLPPFWRTFQHPDAASARRAVKAGVLSLVLLDAVIAAAYAGPVYSLGVIVTAIAAGWLARRFSVT